MNLTYCYGVVDISFKTGNSGFQDAKLNPQAKTPIIGFESGKIYTISFKDITAIASDVSEDNFSQEVVDKNIKNIKWLAENGQVHESVITSIMQKTTVVPMKFCTIFKAKENVESMLEEKYADFRFNLKNLRDKFEIGVKVYFDTGPLKQKIAEESPDIQELEKEAEKKPKGAAYFDRQKIDAILKRRIQQKLSSNKKIIFNKIKPFAVDSKENEPLNKKLTKKDMMLNAVFLVNKNSLNGFNGNIEKIRAEHKDFEIEVWGPFPCYNFVR